MAQRLQRPNIFSFPWGALAEVELPKNEKLVWVAEAESKAAVSTCDREACHQSDAQCICDMYVLISC